MIVRGQSRVFRPRRRRGRQNPDKPDDSPRTHKPDDAIGRKSNGRRFPEKMRFLPYLADPFFGLLPDDGRVVAQQRNPLHQPIWAFLSHKSATRRDSPADNHRMPHEPRKRVGQAPMRVAILTSVETRHRFFANAIHRRFEAAAIVYARPTYAPAEVDDSELTSDEQAIVRAHFAERSRQEELFFGHLAGWIESGTACPVQHVEPGRLNTLETAQSLQDRGINTIVVFGTDLIKPPLLAPDVWTMINMHLGLSPYYRGTATNFYPLLNEEPEYVGATIHRLDAGIDSGPILQHARPEIVASDGPHAIGCKAISAGIAAMADVLEIIQKDGEMPGVPQWREENSKIYYRRDYHPRQIVELYQKLERGMLSRVLSEARPAPRLVRCPCHAPGSATVRRESTSEVGTCAT